MTFRSSAPPAQALCFVLIPTSLTAASCCIPNKVYFRYDLRRVLYILTDWALWSCGRGGHVSAYCSVTLAWWLPAVHTGQSRAGRSLPPRAWRPAPPWLWLGPASGGNACNRCLPPHRQSFSAAPPPFLCMISHCLLSRRSRWRMFPRGRGKWRWSLCISVHVVLLKLSGAFWLVPK